MLNLLVVCNKLVSSFLLMLSYGFWHFHHPYLLASSVLCIAFAHIESCAYFASTSKIRGRTFSCSLTHKPIHLPQTATIPTYHSISIAVPRYINMQLYFTLLDLLAFIIYLLLCMILYNWCVVYPCYARSLHILLHWQRHIVLYIMLYSYELFVPKVCCHFRVFAPAWKEPRRPLKSEIEKRKKYKKEKKKKKE